jgi:DNA-binding MarR family transcriptional regulator
LWIAAHRGERLVAHELERDGVDTPQLALLLLVERHQPATLTALATELGVPFMTASDAVTRLVDAELVSRAPNPDDRRSQLVSLTPAGRARLKAAQKPMRRALQLLAESPGADLSSAAAALAELNAALATALAGDR